MLILAMARIQLAPYWHHSGGILRISAALQSFIALFLLGGFLTSCATGPAHLNLPAGKSLSVTKNAWGHYQDYLSKLGGEDGVFLFAVEGDLAYAGVYYYCPEAFDRCQASSPINRANDLCEENKLKCVLFARGRTIVAKYQVVD